MNKFDLFQEPIPMFNLRGRNTVASISGTIVSIFIIVTLVIYTTIKFIQLESRANPNISSYIEEGVIFGRESEINFADSNFMLAWTIEGYIDRETKLDSRYVKGFARLYNRKNGVYSETLVDYHECSIQEL